jgi:CMP-N-acetylneuraminic acid synthetase
VINGKRILAIIPARGGSKRLPQKNILELSGKPLIAWTIEAALASKYIDRVVVSTDSDKIAHISKIYGADVPFLRPNSLATDKSASIDVVLQLLDKLELIDDYYDYIILLQPTSPLRTTMNIDESIMMLMDRKCDAIISVCEAEHSPLWSNIIPENGNLSNFLDESILNKRSQDLDKYHRLNGAIYFCDSIRIKKEKTFFFNSNCIAYRMTQEQSIDIDTQLDFLKAEFFMNHIKY